MKPSDYIPNEPERNPLHEFICASVAACVASIYPRADPERFVKIVNRTKAPACIAQAPVAEYCTRNGCDCPCCEAAHAKLRALSAETSPRPCRCETCAYFAAKTGRCDADPSEVTVVYSDHNAKESLGAAVVQAVRAAVEVRSESQDSGPRQAGID